ncbi:hypothetical protein [Moorena producens]
MSNWRGFPHERLHQDRVIIGSHSNKVNKILSEVPDSRLPIPDSPPGRD